MATSLLAKFLRLTSVVLVCVAMPFRSQWSSKICSLEPAAKPAFPLPIHNLVEILWVLSLTVRPNPYRPLVFFVPIAVLIVWSMSCTRIQLNNVGNELGLASRMFIVLLSASADILLSEPQQEVKIKDDLRGKKLDDFEDEKRSHLSSNASNGQSTASQNGHQNTKGRRYSEEISSAPFFTRLRWGATLHFNPRGIGYNHEPTPYLPSKPPATTTRRTFVLQRLFAISIFYILIDVGRISVHLYDARRRWMNEHHGGLGTFDSWRLVNLGFGLKFFAMLSYMHTWMAVMAVGLGFSKPSDWPFFFDHLELWSAYTLRTFWGKFWHQAFRRIFLVHANFIAHSVLRLPQSRSKMVFYTKVFLAFFLSGMLHYMGDAVTLQSLSKPGSLQFYLLQAVGLLIEDSVISLWGYFARTTTSITKSQPPSKHDGASKMPIDSPTLPALLIFKIIGFAWVCFWLGWTLPFSSDPMLDGGYLNDMSNGAYSIGMGLWNGQWVWPENNEWIWEGK